MSIQSVNAGRLGMGLAAFLCFLAGAACATAAAKADRVRISFPSTGISVTGRATLLAIDDVSLPLKRNLCYYLTKPNVRREPVVAPSRDNPSAPDYLAAHFYGTVLHERGKFRMWYYACHKGRNPDWPAELASQADKWKDAVIPGPLCYAESDDGIQWTKPELGQFVFKGSRNHNALHLPSALTGNACLIRDDEDRDPARRYKLAFWSQYEPAFAPPTMRTATSAEGLVWKAAPEPPIHSFFEHASFYKHAGLFIVNAQSMPPGESGRERGRQGTAWVSPDFKRWLGEHGESFALPAVEGTARDEVHLGVGATSLGNVCVGLHCVWHNHAEYGKISGDLGLAVSNDGINFREPVKGHVFLSTKDSPVTPIPGKDLPTVLCQANGILNVGDETRIYHGRWRNADYGKSSLVAEDYYAEVALATLPRDRWGALGLNPGEQQGSLWTAPVLLPTNGCRLSLNVEGVSGIRVEAADEWFGVLPGFSESDSGRPEKSDGFDCAVSWGSRTLKELGGRAVRFRVQMASVNQVQPRLYAIYIDP